MAVLLWVMAVVLGGAGTALAYGLSWAAAGLWQAILGSGVAGLFCGVLIAGAVLATMKARGRQTSGVLVFAASLVVGAVVFGFVGYLGQRSAEQDSSDACSAEARDVLAQLSFYADLDQPPTGTQYGSCYVVYTMGETGQQASDQVQQLLAENGWPLECDPVFRDDGGYRCQSGWQDGLMLEASCPASRSSTAKRGERFWSSRNLTLSTAAGSDDQPPNQPQTAARLPRPPDPAAAAPRPPLPATSRWRSSRPPWPPGCANHECTEPHPSGGG